MKKLAVNIVVFLIIYSIIHVLVVCMFGRNLVYYSIGSYGHMYSRIKEIPSHHNPDILFLGSSHSYRGFDSRIFTEKGITTFNLGSSSQTPKQTEVLLKQYLAEIKPKMIVFEVFPMVFQNNGIESTTDLISNDHIDFEVCKLAIKSGNVKVMNTLIYGLYQEYMCNIRDTFKEDGVKDGDMYISGGFVEKLDYSHFVGNQATINAKPIAIRSDQLRAFKRCINMIKSCNLPYLLLISPLPKSTNQNYSNMDEFVCVMSFYGKCVDFNGIIQLEDSCFYDGDHLTQYGVCLFNESLIHVLDTIELKEYKEYE